MTKAGQDPEQQAQDIRRLLASHGIGTHGVTVADDGRGNRICHVDETTWWLVKEKLMCLVSGEPRPGAETAPDPSTSTPPDGEEPAARYQRLIREGHRPEAATMIPLHPERHCRRCGLKLLLKWEVREGRCAGCPPPEPEA